MDVIILSGGKGTRSVDPGTPKSMQELMQGVKVIDTIHNSLNRLKIGHIIPVLGHHKIEQKKMYSRIFKEYPIKFAESTDMGTSHAVVEGASKSSSRYCIVLMADSAMSIPVEKYAELIEESKSDGLILCRHSEHPQDSDSIEIDSAGKFKNFFRKGLVLSEQINQPVLSLSSLIIFKRETLLRLPLTGDFQENLFKTVTRENLKVDVVKTRFSVRDTGTPSRLKKVQESYKSGAFTRRGELDLGAIFIDRDGTLIKNTGDARSKINHDEIEKSTLEAFLEVNSSGIPIFIITNQPGIAKGKITENIVERTFFEIQECLNTVGAIFDDYRYCPHHPENGWDGEITRLKIDCNCRKPKIGMLLDIAKIHHISIEKSYFIGDTEIDEATAKNANMHFLKVDAQIKDDVANAIRLSMKEILRANK